MKLIDQSFKIVSYTPDMEKLIEFCGRTCYQSRNKITEDSHKKFIKSLIDRGHESVIEHGLITAEIKTNRGIMAELTRHRLASFSISSTRYLRLDGDIEFIKPVWWNDWGSGAQYYFKEALESSEYGYKILLKEGSRPEQARELLPEALATTIIISTNPREWRHIFKLRTSKAAHPQFRTLAKDMLKEFSNKWSSLFGDIEND